MRSFSDTIREARLFCLTVVLSLRSEVRKPAARRSLRSGSRTLCFLARNRNEQTDHSQFAVKIVSPIEFRLDHKAAGCIDIAVPLPLAGRSQAALEQTPGCNALDDFGALLVDIEGDSITLELSVSGPVSRLSQETLHEYVPVLKEAAAQMGLMLA